MKLTHKILIAVLALAVGALVIDDTLTHYELKGCRQDFHTVVSQAATSPFAR